MDDRDIARTKKQAEDFERQANVEAVVFVILAVTVLVLFAWMEMSSFDRQMDLMHKVLENTQGRTVATPTEPQGGAERT